MAQLLYFMLLGSIGNHHLKVFLLKVFVDPTPAPRLRYAEALFTFHVTVFVPRVVLLVHCIIVLVHHVVALVHHVYVVLIPFVFK